MSFVVVKLLILIRTQLLFEMDTPPQNTGPTRFNQLHFRRGDAQDEHNKNDLLNKFGPKYHFYKKDLMPVMAERQNINKIMADMKKHVSYLQNSKWMYQNNGEMHPLDHLSHNVL